VTKCRTEETDPQETEIYTVTVCCHVYYNRNYINTSAIFQNFHTRYTADAGITDYTSYARFCVVRRLSINQYAYCRQVGTLKLEDRTRDLCNQKL
jgi:hypothetical protein